MLALLVAKPVPLRGMLAACELAAAAKQGFNAGGQQRYAHAINGPGGVPIRAFGSMRYPR
jgi:hypothetical protein